MATEGAAANTPRQDSAGTPLVDGRVAVLTPAKIENLVNKGVARRLEPALAGTEVGVPQQQGGE